MNFSKVLSMSDTCITSYPRHANMLACVGQYENSIQWFYNYYVQIYSSTYLLDGCYIDFCAPLPWRACPWFHFQRINRDMVKKGWSSVTKFIMDCIDSNYYVFLYLDQFYIPNSLVYQTRHFPHDSFIFGYDRWKKQFNIADFYKYSKYGFTTASFSQVNKAFRDEKLLQASDQLEGIVLVKPVKHDYFNFDVNAMRVLIEDYLQSKLTSKSYTDNYRIEVGDTRNIWVYGLKVYSYLIEFIDLLLQKKVQSELRSFQVLVDHKTLMQLRIKYLAENQLLSNADSIYQEYDLIVNESVRLRNMVIKNYINGKESILQNLMGKIPEIVTKEKDALEKLLDNLVDTK